MSLSKYKESIDEVELTLSISWMVFGIETMMGLIVEEDREIYNLQIREPIQSGSKICVLFLKYK